LFRYDGGMNETTSAPAGPAAGAVSSEAVAARVAELTAAAVMDPAAPASPSDAAGSASSAAGHMSGRRKQAARNDQLILESARAVFLEDPGAPITAVALHAKVGISALYSRYGSKEELLRRLCAEGLARFVAETEAALADPGEPWTVFAGFIRRLVAADTSSMTLALAGRFTPTPAMFELAMRSDVLLRDSSGLVVLWTMNGGQIANNQAVASLGLDWNIQGTGDFNGDGRGDVLLRNDNGQVAIWQMNGAQIASNLAVAAPGRRAMMQRATKDFGAEALPIVAAIGQVQVPSLIDLIGRGDGMAGGNLDRLDLARELHGFHGGDSSGAGGVPPLGLRSRRSTAPVAAGD